MQGSQLILWCLIGFASASESTLMDALERMKKRGHSFLGALDQRIGRPRAPLEPSKSGENPIVLVLQGDMEKNLPQGGGGLCRNGQPGCKPSDLRRDLDVGAPQMHWPLAAQHPPQIQRDPFFGHSGGTVLFPPHLHQDQPGQRGQSVRGYHRADSQLHHFGDAFSGDIPNNVTSSTQSIYGSPQMGPVDQSSVFKYALERIVERISKMLKGKGQKLPKQTKNVHVCNCHCHCHHDATPHQEHKVPGPPRKAIKKRSRNLLKAKLVQKRDELKQKLDLVNGLRWVRDTLRGKQ